MVCMGNICRSPIAAAVLQDRVDRAALPVSVSSAGTGGWHVGGAADHRSVAALESAGYSIRHSARQFQSDWFESHDLIVAMDAQNRDDLLALRPTATVHLLRTWDPDGGGDVPDPYYGARGDFDAVVAMVERSCARLVDWLLASGLVSAPND